MIVKFLDKFGKLVKSITSIGYLPVDVEPVKDSKHLLASGAVANISSSIAPEYSTTSTYPANSYVMHGGFLYTNPNAIGTAEDWNPAHWTQTTVAEMMASAAPSWTHNNQSESISGGQTKDLTIDNHKFVTLTATRRPPTTNPATLRLHFNDECIVVLDKAVGVKVNTYIGSTVLTPTTNISAGSTAISLNDSGVAVKAMLHYYAGHLVITPIA